MSIMLSTVVYQIDMELGALRPLKSLLHELRDTLLSEGIDPFIKVRKGVSCSDKRAELEEVIMSPHTREHLPIPPQRCGTKLWDI